MEATIIKNTKIKIFTGSKNLKLLTDYWVSKRVAQGLLGTVVVATIIDGCARITKGPKKNWCLPAGSFKEVK